MELFKQAILRLLQAFIVLGSIVIALAVAVWLYPPLFPWGLAQFDRSPFCPQDEAFRAAQRRYELIRSIGTVQSAFHLLETDPSGFELWQTGVGQFWVPEGHIGALSVAIAADRVDLYGGAAFSVREGDVVLDCSAAAGAYVRDALRLGASKVIAIENNPMLRESLRRNFKDAIEQGQVVVYPKEQKDSAMQAGDVGVDGMSSPETPASTRIDALLEELKIERVDVIKMEAHGMALRALDGARNTIEKSRPRLAVSTQEAEDDENKIKEWLMALNVGYTPECQVCGVAEWTIRPDVVLFRAPAL